MTIDSGWLSVCGPSGMSNRRLRQKGLVEIDAGFVGQLSELLYLADLLDDDHICIIISFDSNACFFLKHARTGIKGTDRHCHNHDTQVGQDH